MKWLKQLFCIHEDIYLGFKYTVSKGVNVYKKCSYQCTKCGRIKTKMKRAGVD